MFSGRDEVRFTPALVKGKQGGKIIECAGWLKSSKTICGRKAVFWLLTPL